MLVTQLTSTDVLKDFSGGEESWQVVLSFNSRVHLEPVRQSPLGAWWFLTSGQADVQRTWIKHMAHLTTDWRLSKCLMKYEVRFQFTKTPFVRYLWCSIKYVWHSCSLTWVAKQGSVAVMTIKPETGSSKDSWGEWEGNWMDLSLSARNRNRNVMWPVTTKCLSTDKTPCGPGGSKIHVPQCFSHFLLFQNVFIFLPQRKGWAQQFSSAGGRIGTTACAPTSPTQSWSCTVFKAEKQSQKSRVGLHFHTGEEGLFV